MNCLPTAKNGGRNGTHRWRWAPKQYKYTNKIVMNNPLLQFQFKLIITMLFSYCCGWQWNQRWQKWRRFAGNFDCHGDAAVRRGAHRPIEHVQGFTGSHWMPLSGECLRRIALAAAMVNEFVITTQNTNKTQLLASNYGTFRAIGSCLWEFHTPKRTLYSAHRCDELRNNVNHHDWSWRARGHL